MTQRILLFYLLFLTRNVANAQIYDIKSFDGSIQKVYILEHENGTLTVSCEKNIVCLKNFNNIVSISTLSPSLLKIIYVVRAGTGMHCEHTLILGVKNKTLCQTLHVTSLFHEEFIDFSKPVDTLNLVSVKTKYEVNFDFGGRSRQSYKLNVKINDEKQSKDNPKSNYNHHDETTLGFDTIQNVFYSTYQDISKYFTIYNPQNHTDIKQYILGNFPVLKLYKNEYYYIKNEWYEKVSNDELARYTYN